MRSLHKNLCVLLASLLLNACTRWGDLPLLQIDPAALGPAQVAQQRMQLSWRGETHVLENVLESGPDGLQVVGLAMGLRVYSFSYDGHKLQTGPGHLPRGLSEQRIANDLLLTHAPLDALVNAMPVGWQITEQTTAAGQRQRLLQQDKETVIEVKYDAGAPWAGRSVLIHHRDGYQLILDSVSET
ncbi:MAG: hypothetical protein H6R07_3146 [Proteobacteria bacterium]|nr:hypothetical protein [Pseudomonadota bacterium]